MAVLTSNKATLTKMKIAYVGNFEPEWSTENDVRKAFEELGHEVIKLQENASNTVGRLFEMLDFQDKPFDLLLITSTWDDVIPMSQWLDILHRCATLGIPTATYHLDVFWGSDRGDRRWWQNPMFQTGYVFTASNDWNKEWRNMGVNHIWLRPAVRHDAVHLGKFREEYACDVAFVGSNGVGYHEGAWPYRRELVDKLREMCQRNGWTWQNRGGDHPKVDRNEDRNDFYASAKVTVGDSLCQLKEKSEYCSDRVYEATGCGGFLIMPRLDFLEDDFDGRLPMYDWGDFDGLEEQIKFWLENQKARLDVQDYCYKVSAGQHTYVERVQTILETVGLV